MAKPVELDTLEQKLAEKNCRWRISYSSGAGEVVRKMFDLYLQGLSFGQIKSFLESQGIKTVTGKETWDAKTIQRMLTNEKYKGDTMLQKTFTEDFMTGKKSKNIGQRNQYYVKDSHPAIFPLKYSIRCRKKWQSVQGS